MKCSIIYSYGVVMERAIAGMPKHRFFYCMAHSTCRKIKYKTKMSNGSTSSPAEHLAKHGVRAQKTVMIEERRMVLVGKLNQSLSYLLIYCRINNTFSV